MKANMLKLLSRFTVHTNSLLCTFISQIYKDFHVEKKRRIMNLLKPFDFKIIMASKK